MLEEPNPYVGSRSANLYYKTLGRITAGSFVFIPLFGCIAAAILAAIYGYLTVYNPFIYINFLGTLGFGFGLGAACAMGVLIGKLRSPVIAALLGLLVGVFAVYASWVVWMHAFWGRLDHDVWIINPFELWELISLAAANGVWTLKSWTPTGAVLYTFWAIEAVIISGFSMFMSMGGANESFCEPCEQWLDTELENLFMLVKADKKTIKQSLESGDISVLEPRFDEPESSTQVSITLDLCSGCQKEAFLTVQEVTIKQKGKEAKEERKDIVSRLIVRPEYLEKIRQLPTRIVEAVQAIQQSEALQMDDEEWS